VQWRQYFKDVLLLGSIVLPVSVVAISAVQHAEGGQGSFVDYLTSPRNLGGLGLMTAYVLIRPLRRPARKRTRTL